MRSHSPGEPVDMLGARHADPVTTMGARVRSQFVVVVPSLSHRAPRQAPADLFQPEPD
jgi:hypothetical protein